MQTAKQIKKHLVDRLNLDEDSINIFEIPTEDRQDSRIPEFEEYNDRVIIRYKTESQQ